MNMHIRAGIMALVFGLLGCAGEAGEVSYIELPTYPVQPSRLYDQYHVSEYLQSPEAAANKAEAEEWVKKAAAEAEDQPQQAIYGYKKSITSYPMSDAYLALARLLKKSAEHEEAAEAYLMVPHAAQDHSQWAKNSAEVLPEMVDALLDIPHQEYQLINLLTTQQVPEQTLRTSPGYARLRDSPLFRRSDMVALLASGKTDPAALRSLLVESFPKKTSSFELAPGKVVGLLSYEGDIIRTVGSEGTVFEKMLEKLWEVNDSLMPAKPAYNAGWSPIARLHTQEGLDILLAGWDGTETAAASEAERRYVYVVFSLNAQGVITDVRCVGGQQGDLAAGFQWGNDRRLRVTRYRVRQNGPKVHYQPLVTMTSELTATGTWQDTETP